MLWFAGCGSGVRRAGKGWGMVVGTALGSLVRQQGPVTGPEETKQAPFLLGNKGNERAKLSVWVTDKEVHQNIQEGTSDSL